MKKVLLALALMVVLLMLASAENDSVTTGPYKISFDLGLHHSDYNITVKEPKETESLGGEKSTEYGIEITNRTGTFRIADIYLTHYEKYQRVPNADEMAVWLRKLWSNTPENSNIETTTRQ